MFRRLVSDDGISRRPPSDSWLPAVAAGARVLSVWPSPGSGVLLGEKESLDGWPPMM